MATENKKPVSLQVDDGLEEITICNKYGKTVGTFYFCPTDTAVLSRYEKAASMVEEALRSLQERDPLENVEEDDEELKVLGLEFKKATEAVCAAFDYLFSGNVGEAFFSSCSPLAVTNGRFYCENVLESLGGYIAKRVQEETGAVNARVEKYTHGVRTGKHAKGKS